METNKVTKMNTDELVFSLDIGTRTVIGLVGKYKDNNLEIVESDIIEHDERNMYDGQIHDIGGVTEIVRKIKDRLENKLGQKLDKVSIAAAGRALETYRVIVEKNIENMQEVNKRIIEGLEMEAIQKAQGAVENQSSDGGSQYYCVGYSVVNYLLDGNIIENLEGHRGRKVSADVLATFLPHTVVDSLYTVMSRVGLEVVNLTLEPIAAINVAIKKSLRLLNLALVDIGAGTSDIAITKDGTIIAYAMASVAGDEITEKIAKTFLLDYDIAEKLKISLNSKDEHKFYDVVGIEHNLTTEEVLDRINDAIEDLAREIGDKILKYNEKAPSVIFLIGGGSQIPRLTNYIANYLKMPEPRVVVRDTSIIENVKGIPEALNGPNAITPIGIAKTAIDSKYKDFLEVVINGQKVKLFNSKQIKVSNALILIGYNPRDLIPKRGEDFTYYVNSEKKVIKGDVGEPAKIYVNGSEANLEYRLLNGDNIKVIKSTSGEKPQAPRIYDCVKMVKRVLFNDHEVKLIESIKVNNELITEDRTINEHDKIEVKEIDILGELFKAQDLSITEYNVRVNGNEVEENYLLHHGDKIVTKKIKMENNASNENKEEIADKNSNSYNKENMDIKNNKDIPVKKTIELIINGSAKMIEYVKKDLIFVDLFNYIDFDLSKPKGIIILKVNGKKAEFAQKLKDGDNIEIYWEKPEI
ncbi:cell division protein FtsA [Sporosalibacterium faouarense]|uniref:cell division protein FtsA n=1 Tax=Sporosalibacterium faouarense TaxID=516123 RepID=UPI00192B715C|nr:cell division protein FtsA [Sporosalibacterium faouarense]